jgi:hypothetical protein
LLIEGQVEVEILPLFCEQFHMPRGSMGQPGEGEIFSLKKNMFMKPYGGCIW